MKKHLKLLGLWLALALACAALLGGAALADEPVPTEPGLYWNGVQDGRPIWTGGNAAIIWPGRDLDIYFGQIAYYDGEDSVSLDASYRLEITCPTDSEFETRTVTETSASNCFSIGCDGLEANRAYRATVIASATLNTEPIEMSASVDFVVGSTDAFYAPNVSFGNGFDNYRIPVNQYVNIHIQAAGAQDVELVTSEWTRSLYQEGWRDFSDIWYGLYWDHEITDVIYARVHYTDKVVGDVTVTGDARMFQIVESEKPLDAPELPNNISTPLNRGEILAFDMENPGVDPWYVQGLIVEVYEDDEGQPGDLIWDSNIGCNADGMSIDVRIPTAAIPGGSYWTKARYFKSGASSLYCDPIPLTVVEPAQGGAVFGVIGATYDENAQSYSVSIDDFYSFYAYVPGTSRLRLFEDGNHVGEWDQNSFDNWGRSYGEARDHTYELACWNKDANAWFKIGSPLTVTVKATKQMPEPSFTAVVVDPQDEENSPALGVTVEKGSRIRFRIDFLDIDGWTDKPDWFKQSNIDYRLEIYDITNNRNWVDGRDYISLYVPTLGENEPYPDPDPTFFTYDMFVNDAFHTYEAVVTADLGNGFPRTQKAFRFAVTDGNVAQPGLTVDVENGSVPVNQRFRFSVTAPDYLNADNISGIDIVRTDNSGDGGWERITDDYDASEDVNDWRWSGGIEDPSAVYDEETGCWTWSWWMCVDRPCDMTYSAQISYNDWQDRVFSNVVPVKVTKTGDAVVPEVTHAADVRRGEALVVTVPACDEDSVSGYELRVAGVNEYGDYYKDIGELYVPCTDPGSAQEARTYLISTAILPEGTYRLDFTFFGKPGYENAWSDYYDSKWYFTVTDNQPEPIIRVVGDAVTPHEENGSIVPNEYDVPTGAWYTVDGYVPGAGSVSLFRDGTNEYDGDWHDYWGSDSLRHPDRSDHVQEHTFEICVWNEKDEDWIPCGVSAVVHITGVPFEVPDDEITLDRSAPLDSEFTFSFKRIQDAEWYIVTVQRGGGDWFARWEGISKNDLTGYDDNPTNHNKRSLTYDEDKGVFTATAMLRSHDDKLGYDIYDGEELKVVVEGFAYGRDASWSEEFFYAVSPVNPDDPVLTLSAAPHGENGEYYYNMPVTFTLQMPEPNSNGSEDNGDPDGGEGSGDPEGEKTYLELPDSAYIELLWRGQWIPAINQDSVGEDYDGLTYTYDRKNGTLTFSPMSYNDPETVTAMVAVDFYNDDDEGFVYSNPLLLKFEGRPDHEIPRPDFEILDQDKIFDRESQGVHIRVGQLGVPDYLEAAMQADNKEIKDYVNGFTIFVKEKVYDDPNNPNFYHWEDRPQYYWNIDRILEEAMSDDTSGFGTIRTLDLKKGDYCLQFGLNMNETACEEGWYSTWTDCEAEDLQFHVNAFTQAQGPFLFAEYWGEANQDHEGDAYYVGMNVYPEEWFAINAAVPGEARVCVFRDDLERGSWEEEWSDCALFRNDRFDEWDVGQTFTYSLGIWDYNEGEFVPLDNSPTFKVTVVERPEEERPKLPEPVITIPVSSLGKDDNDYDEYTFTFRVEPGSQPDDMSDEDYAQLCAGQTFEVEVYDDDLDRNNYPTDEAYDEACVIRRSDMTWWSDEELAENEYHLSVNLGQGGDLTPGHRYRIVARANKDDYDGSDTVDRTFIANIAGESRVALEIVGVEGDFGDKMVHVPYSAHFPAKITLADGDPETDAFDRPVEVEIRSDGPWNHLWDENMEDAENIWNSCFDSETCVYSTFEFIGPGECGLVARARWSWNEDYTYSDTVWVNADQDQSMPDLILSAHTVETGGALTLTVGFPDNKFGDFQERYEAITVCMVPMGEGIDYAEYYNDNSWVSFYDDNDDPIPAENLLDGDGNITFTIDTSGVNRWVDDGNGGYEIFAPLPVGEYYIKVCLHSWKGSQWTEGGEGLDFEVTPISLPEITLSTDSVAYADESDNGKLTVTLSDLDAHKSNTGSYDIHIISVDDNGTEYWSASADDRWIDMQDEQTGDSASVTFDTSSLYTEWDYDNDQGSGDPVALRPGMYRVHVHANGLRDEHGCGYADNWVNGEDESRWFTVRPAFFVDTVNPQTGEWTAVQDLSQPIQVLTSQGVQIHAVMPEGDYCLFQDGSVRDQRWRHEIDGSGEICFPCSNGEPRTYEMRLGVWDENYENDELPGEQRHWRPLGDEYSFTLEVSGGNPLDPPAFESVPASLTTADETMTFSFNTVEGVGYNFNINAEDYGWVCGSDVNPDGLEELDPDNLPENLGWTYDSDNETYSIEWKDDQFTQPIGMAYDLNEKTVTVTVPLWRNEYDDENDPNHENDPIRTYSVLTEGMALNIDLSANALGRISNYSSRSVACVPAVDPGEPYVTLSVVSGTDDPQTTDVVEALVNEDLTINLKVSDDIEYDVYNVRFRWNRGGQMYYFTDNPEDPDENAYYLNDLSLSEPYNPFSNLTFVDRLWEGDYTLLVKLSRKVMRPVIDEQTGDETGDYDEAWEDCYSNPVSVHVTATHIDAPAVEIISGLDTEGQIARGQQLGVRIGDQHVGVQSYHVRVYEMDNWGCDDNQVPFFQIYEPAAGEPLEILIPTANMKSRRSYGLSVYVDTVPGYIVDDVFAIDDEHEDLRFYVTPGESSFSTDRTSVLTEENFTLSAYVPGATELCVVADYDGASELNDYDFYWTNGGSVSGSWEDHYSKAGVHTYDLYQRTNESNEWTPVPGVQTVVVEVTAPYNTLAEPTFTALDNTISVPVDLNDDGKYDGENEFDGILRFGVAVDQLLTDEDAGNLHVEVWRYNSEHYYDNNSNGGDKLAEWISTELREFALDPSDTEHVFMRNPLQIGEQYWINAWTWKKGYNGNGSETVVRVVPATVDGSPTMRLEVCLEGDLDGEGNPVYQDASTVRLPVGADYRIRFSVDADTNDDGVDDFDLASVELRWDQNNWENQNYDPNNKDRDDIWSNIFAGESLNSGSYRLRTPDGRGFNELWMRAYFIDYDGAVYSNPIRLEYEGADLPEPVVAFTNVESRVLGEDTEPTPNVIDRGTALQVSLAMPNGLIRDDRTGVDRISVDIHEINNDMSFGPSIRGLDYNPTETTLSVDTLSLDPGRYGFMLRAFGQPGYICSQIVEGDPTMIFTVVEPENAVPEIYANGESSIVVTTQQDFIITGRYPGEDRIALFRNGEQVMSWEQDSDNFSWTDCLWSSGTYTFNLGIWIPGVDQYRLVEGYSAVVNVVADDLAAPEIDADTLYIGWDYCFNVKRVAGADHYSIRLYYDSDGYGEEIRYNNDYESFDLSDDDFRDGEWHTVCVPWHLFDRFGGDHNQPGRSVRIEVSASAYGCDPGYAQQRVLMDNPTPSVGLDVSTEDESLVLGNVPVRTSLAFNMGVGWVWRPTKAEFFNGEAWQEIYKVSAQDENGDPTSYTFNDALCDDNQNNPYNVDFYATCNTAGTRRFQVRVTDGDGNVTLSNTREVTFVDDNSETVRIVADQFCRGEDFNFRVYPVEDAACYTVSLTDEKGNPILDAQTYYPSDFTEEDELPVRVDASYFNFNDFDTGAIFTINVSAYDAGFDASMNVIAEGTMRVSLEEYTPFVNIDFVGPDQYSTENNMPVCNGFGLRLITNIGEIETAEVWLGDHFEHVYWHNENMEYDDNHGDTQNYDYSGNVDQQEDGFGIGRCTFWWACGNPGKRDFKFRITDKDGNQYQSGRKSVTFVEDENRRIPDFTVTIPEANRSPREGTSVPIEISTGSLDNRGNIHHFEVYINGTGNKYDNEYDRKEFAADAATVSIPTGKLDPGKTYRVRVKAWGKPGSTEKWVDEDSETRCFYLQPRLSNDATFTVSSDTVMIGDSVIFSGYVPGATRLEVVNVNKRKSDGTIRSSTLIGGDNGELIEVDTRYCNEFAFDDEDDFEFALLAYYEGNDEPTEACAPLTVSVHKWAETSFNWTDEGDAVVAERFCETTGCQVHYQTEKVMASIDEDPEPTCVTGGYRTYSIDSNGFGNDAFRSEFQALYNQDPDAWMRTENIEALGHKLIHHAAVAPTCTANGTKEYWECDRCDRNFWKEEAEDADEIANDDDLVIPASHTLMPVDAKAPTCTEDGWTEYYECQVCWRLFRDADGEQEITDQSEITVPATGHNLEHRDGQPAACTEAGWKEYWECVNDGCGMRFSDQFGKKPITEPQGIPATGHNLEHRDGQPATCTEAGWIEHWECVNDGCGVRFSDEEGETPITDDSWVIPASHALEAHAAVVATCTTAGTEAYWECTVCHTLFSDAEGQKEIDAPVAIPAKGHAWSDPTYEWADDNSSVTATRVCGNDESHVETETATATGEVTKEATCTAKGETTYTSAAFANEAFAAQTKTVDNIPATDHAYGAATYEWAADNKSVTATRVCGNGASHTETETATATGEVTKAATCTAKGETTYTSAAFANEAFAVQMKTVDDIPAKGHAWGAATYEWAADNSSVTATRVCGNDASHTETETATATGKVTKEATCMAKGETTYTSAAFANEAFAAQTKTVDNIPATDHAYGAATYVWAADNKSVTATRVCGNDESHVETETATATGKVTKEATCTAKGETTYTSAAFANEAFAAQTKTVDDIPAKGHAWSAATYEWAADNSSVTATRVCGNDASHVETETANATSAVTTPATYEAKGERTYTAAFENTGFATQTRKVDIPMLEKDNAVKSVEAAIDALSEENVGLGDKSAVDAALAAYNKLTEAQKAQVNANKLNKLTTIESQVKAAEKAATEKAAAEKAAAEKKAAEDKSAADAAIAKINALPSSAGTNDKAAVEAARAAYNALTDDQKKLVSADVVSRLTGSESQVQAAEKKAAEDKAAAEKKAAEDKSAADAAIAKINALPASAGTGDKAAVEAARAAYNALTDDQKALVSAEVLAKLTGSESQVKAAEEQAAAEAKAAEEAKAAAEKKAAEDKAAADAAIEKINALPSSAGTGDKAAVEAARAAYSALTDDQKALVSAEVLAKLTGSESQVKAAEEQAAAEQAAAEQKAAEDKAAANAVIEKIKAVPAEAGANDKAAVEAARTAYNALTDDQKALVDAAIGSNVETKLTAAESQVKAAEEQAAAEAKAAEEARAAAEKKAAEDKAAADAAIEKIKKLPSSAGASDKDAVEAARAAYNALTDDQKALVSAEVVSKLTTAETQVTQATSRKKLTKSNTKITVKDQTWSGKAKTPKPTVKVGKKTLKKGTDYTVSYSNNVKVGKATVTIKGKGKYTGKVTATFKINPKKVSNLKLKVDDGKLIATWKSVKDVTGYQIEYSLTKDFKKSTKLKVKKFKTVEAQLKKAKAGKAYYVRIRAYQTVKKQTYYSAWSKTVKSKKIEE